MKFQDKTARDVMSRKLTKITPELSMRRAAEVMLARRISGAPVVERGGKLVGVLSLRDIVRSEHDASAGREPAFYIEGGHIEIADPWIAADERPVREAMTKTVISVEENTSIGDLCAVMSTRRIHRVFVMNKGRLVGLVSSMDVLRAVPKRAEKSGRSVARRKS